MARFVKRFKAGYTKEIKKHKVTFGVFLMLRLLVVLLLIVSCAARNYESIFYCALTLILFMIPTFVENNFGIELPNALEIVIILFIFAAEILGELGSYYTKIPYWDSILHTVNGFLCAAIGFALTDILNRNEKIKFELSPLFLAVVAFCFSMTIGVLWEFFEFFCDMLTGSDMQKDFVVHSITSTLLGSGTTSPKVLKDIHTTVVNGELLEIDGYLDIGLYDTMKDLIVNCIGAAVFSIIGYFYVKSRGKGRIARLFIPKVKRQKEVENEGKSTEA